MSGIPVDIVFDYETIGPAPRAKLVELSYVPFIDDPYHPPTFAELIQRGRKYKFNLRTQTNRIKNQSTIDWWKKQDPEARRILVPTPEDLDVYEGHKQFFNDLKKDGVSFNQSFDYCRGPEFDRAIMIDVLRDQLGWEADLFKEMPTVFWNSRDVRTAIENRLMTRGLTMVPLRAGLLDGFIKHDSIHDCAKDALMLIYSSRYALGLEDAPEGDDIDLRSIQK